MAHDTARDALLAAIPSMRAFAISLTNNPDLADDLVQSAILSAWANIDRFDPGTNMTAWLFTILRNRFYSDYRKRKREVEDPDEAHAGRLSTAPEQQATVDFHDMRSALARLPLGQREALLLIGAEGLSYEEAAAVCGIAVGTVKSRVNRARVRLAHLLGMDGTNDLGADRMMRAAVQSR